MKKVLITGATGFIGRHCLPLLIERGFEVHAVSSRKQSERSGPVCWHQVDLLDVIQTETLVAEVNPTHLLHFAWITTPKEYWMSPENPRWVFASFELLRAFVLHGGQRVVMAGSCAEYDWRRGRCSERATPLAPTTLYGASKLSLQWMLETYAKSTGLSSAWGRIFFIYGPHEHPERLVPSVICSLLKGKPARCVHGNQIRDFLFIEDVAYAFVVLLESDLSGAINIASGRPIALKEVTYKIAERLGRADLIEIGVVPTSREEPATLVADVQRLRKEMQWQPRYTLDGGLETTISWWESQL